MAVPAARGPARAVRAALVVAVLAWVAADVLGWWGGPARDAPRVASAHVVHLLADALLLVGVWGLAHVQRPRRRRGEGVEVLLVLLGIAVPVWLLWVRPHLATSTADTVGGGPVLSVHLLLLFVTLGAVLWYLVGDVWLAPQDEALRAALVVLVLVDLGPPLPGGTDPAALALGLELLRLVVAVALAAGLVLVPSLLTPRPVGRRHWRPDRRRVVVWAAVALVGPVVLAGGAMMGEEDAHAITVAAVATVVGIALLGLREWLLLRDADRRVGRQSRLAHRMSQREQARTTFLSAAAHDLRTPVTAVRGAAQLLAVHGDRLDAGRRRELLESLVRNADRLDHLLTSLLDVERLTSGQIRAQRELVDVAALARRVAAFPHLRDAPIEVVGTTWEADVDPLMVERILDNLLGNAVRHTPAGTPVWVVLSGLEAGGLRIAVTDAGPGIPPEERFRVLEAFARLPASEGTPGSGLGLSLVAGFARLHGGTVVVAERAGGGAQFVVDLPGGDGDDAREASGTGPGATPIAGVAARQTPLSAGCPPDRELPLAE